MQNGVVEAAVRTLNSLSRDNERRHEENQRNGHRVNAAYDKGRHDAFKLAARLLDQLLQAEVAQDARDHGEEQ